MPMSFAAFTDLESLPSTGFSVDDVLTVGAYDYVVADTAAADFHVELSNGLKLYTSPTAGGVVTSRQLNWQADEDITTRFQQIIDSGLLSGGVEFRLEDSVVFKWHSLQFPDDFTLSAVNGARLIVDDSLDFLIGDDNDLYPFTFHLGARNTLKDLDVIWIDTEPEGVISNIHGFRGAYSDDSRIVGSRFEGNIEMFVAFHQTTNITIEDSVFDGAYWQVRLGGVDGANITSSVFQNALGDGIKTALGDATGTRNVTVEASLFIDNARDGIDTTGGFRDSVVRDSFFVSNGVSAMDFKTPYKANRPLLDEQMNTNILIENTEFYDHGNNIVLTTTDYDGTITPENVDWRTIHNITVRDSVFAGDRGKIFFVKDSHGVYGENLTLLGRFHHFRTEFFGWLEPYDLNLEENDLSQGGVWTPVTDFRALDLDNPVTTYETLFDTGGSLRLSFESARIVASRAEDASGDIRTETYDAFGECDSFTFYDGSDTQVWTSQSVDFDASGNRERVERLFDDGRHVVNNFDDGTMSDRTVSKPSGQVISTIYGPDGAPVSGEITWADGTREVIEYTDGIVTGRVRTEADGDITTQVFDATGTRQSIVREDISDSEDWSVFRHLFGPDGSRSQLSVDYDDGSTSVLNYVNGVKSERIFTEADGDVMTLTFREDGTRERIVFEDVSDSQDWETLTRTFDATGTLIGTDFVWD